MEEKDNIAGNTGKGKSGALNLGFTKRDIARELARRYSTMTYQELDLLESLLIAMRYQRGDYVVKAGEVSTNIYWIVKGLVRQFYFKNGKEVTEYMATENHIVMSIESLFEEKPSKQEIVCLEPSIIVAISRPKLEQVAMKSVNIQILYRKILEESLILSQVQADMQRFESASDRYLKLVKMQPQLVLRAPLVYVASLLQMTPETLSRIRTAQLNEE